MATFPQTAWLGLATALLAACASTSPPASSALTQRDVRAFEGRYANAAFDLLEPTLWSQLGWPSARDKLTSFVDLRIEDTTLVVQLVDDGSIRATKRWPCALRNGGLSIAQARPFSVRKHVPRVVGLHKAVLWQDADHALLVSHDMTGSLWVGAMPLTVAHTRTLAKGYMRTGPLPP